MTNCHIHDAVGHAVAQHIAGARLVDLEQAGLLAAHIADGRVAQHQLQVVGGCAVLLEDAEHAREVRQIGSGAKRRGAGGAVSTGGIAIHFEVEVFLYLVHQRAHCLIEAVGLDAREGARVLQALGLLTIPAHRDVLALGDGHRYVIDDGVTRVRRGLTPGLAYRLSEYRLG